MNRREFIETSAGAMGAAMLPLSESPRVQAASRPIGIQVGAVSFVDEGTDTRARYPARRPRRVNTMFLATFTYGRGIGGRQPRGSRCPITASRSTTTTITAATSRRRIRSTTRNTSITPQKAPDHPQLRRDRRRAAARAQARHEGDLLVRGRLPQRRPGLDQAFEVDVHGGRHARVCSRNPNTRTSGSG